MITTASRTKAASRPTFDHLLQQAHDIGKKVQWAIEDMEEISRAFIHIDPLETT